MNNLQKLAVKISEYSSRKSENRLLPRILVGISEEYRITLAPYGKAQLEYYSKRSAKKRIEIIRDYWRFFDLGFISDDNCLSIDNFLQGAGASSIEDLYTNFKELGKKP